MEMQTVRKSIFLLFLLPSQYLQLYYGAMAVLQWDLIQMAVEGRSKGGLWPVPCLMQRVLRKESEDSTSNSDPFPKHSQHPALGNMQLLVEKLVSFVLNSTQ